MYVRSDTSTIGVESAANATTRRGCGVNSVTETDRKLSTGGITHEKRLEIEAAERGRGVDASLAPRYHRCTAPAGHLALPRVPLLLRDELALPWRWHVMVHRGRRQRGCHDRRAHDVLHLLARARGGRAARRLWRPPSRRDGRSIPSNLLRSTSAEPGVEGRGMAQNDLVTQ